MIPSTVIRATKIERLDNGMLLVTSELRGVQAFKTPANVLMPYNLSDEVGVLIEVEEKKTIYVDPTVVDIVVDGASVVVPTDRIDLIELLATSVTCAPAGGSTTKFETQTATANQDDFTLTEIKAPTVIGKLLVIIANVPYTGEEAGATIVDDVTITFDKKFAGGEVITFIALDNN